MRRLSVILLILAATLTLGCTTSLDLTTDGLKAESAPAGDCGK